jgi:trans-2,3-dihydro-3-hydroxyanthranilate isomerase
VDVYQLDVFAPGPFRGNPLAVFPDAGDLKSEQMQAIAREMNLSETSFVTNVDADGYDARIFTPAEELPFAGHPTLGTAWLLRHLGKAPGDRAVQRTAAGDTEVRFEGDLVWFERPGHASPDLESTDTTSTANLAGALGLREDDVGMEARELGRSGRLMPSLSNAAYDQMMVPVKDVDALQRIVVRPDLLGRAAIMGVYCFSAFRAGAVRARGFFPNVGVDEDPATGSAAAALGIYLADRLGDIDLEVIQGVEINRPSSILVRGRSGTVQVGGRCEMVLEGRLVSLP